MRAPCCLFLCLVLVAASPADTVHLKNGRTLEGVIQQETEQDLVLSIGLGTVRLKRSQIARVERDNPKEREQLQAHWQEHYFNQEPFIPPGFTELGSAFRNLAGTRADARNAQQEETGLAARYRALLAERDQKQTEQLVFARQLEQIDPRVDPQAYNEAVQGNNIAAARLTTLHHDAEEIGKAVEAARARRRQFARAWFDFSTAWPTNAWPEATTEAGRAYRARLQEELAAARLEVQQAELPFREEDHDHQIVTATVNGGAGLRLMLDTGASFVTLSRRAAERAGVLVKAEQQMQVKLADGRQVPATPVLLDRLAVGEASLERVPAVILEGDLGAGLDGLLGMSFLREFVISIDAGGKRLVLTRAR